MVELKAASWVAKSGIQMVGETVAVMALMLVVMKAKRDSLMA